MAHESDPLISGNQTVRYTPDAVSGENNTHDQCAVVDQSGNENKSFLQLAPVVSVLPCFVGHRDFP